MQWEILTPLSIWMQLASFFFTLSGIHGDLLVIRFFLFLAYVMLFLNNMLGSPLWSDGLSAPTNETSSSRQLSIDSLTWSLIGLYVHGSSLWALLQDERPVRFASNELAALWRMMYRTGGLSARIFQHLVAPHVQVIRIDTAEEELNVQDYFYILYQGQVRMRVYDTVSGEFQIHRLLQSGEVFDLKYLDMFSIDTMFDQNDIRCQTVTQHCILFRWARSDLKQLAHQRLAKSVWQALLINNLSYVVESYARGRRDPTPPTNHQHTYGGVDEPMAAMMIDPIFGPLQPYEEPQPQWPGSGQALRRPLQHLIRSITSSFSPPWPLGGHLPGIRQALLPRPPNRPPGWSDLLSTQDPPSFHQARTSHLPVSSSKQNDDSVKKSIGPEDSVSTTEPSNRS